MFSGKNARKFPPYQVQAQDGPFPRPYDLEEDFDSPVSVYGKKRKQSNLKLLRRARGLTLEALSELTGISPSYLSRLEGGARRLNTDLLDRLSRVLDCQAADLLGNGNGQASHASMPTRVQPLNNMPSRFIPGTTPALDGTEALRHDMGFTDNAMAKKDLPVYGVSSPLGLMPGATGKASSIDFTNPADWIFRPAQLLNVRTAFALYVRDLENAPKYMPGNILYVHPARPLSLHCSVVALTKDDRALVRQFNGWGQETLLLLPFSDYGDESKVEEVSRDYFRAVYKIIGVLEDH